jgi:hypothetical protein
MEENTEQLTSPSNVSVSIDISELYKFEPSDLVIEIVEEHYSNLAYIQVTPRDVYIDFLPMPGVKKDGKMVVKGTRIFMSHPAAQKLAEVLGRVLENVHKENGMEVYQPSEVKRRAKRAKEDQP